MSKPQFADYGEPWTYLAGSGYVQDRNARPALADDENRRRCQLCVNACSGLSDEQLRRVRAVNELYESLREVLPYAQSRLEAFGVKPTDPEWEPLKVASRAIALAEGKEG